MFSLFKFYSRILISKINSSIKNLVLNESFVTVCTRGLSTNRSGDYDKFYYVRRIKIR